MDTIIFGVGFVVAVGSAAWMIKSNFDALERKIKSIEENNQAAILIASKDCFNDSREYASRQLDRLRQDLNGVIEEEKRKKNIEICKVQIAAATAQKALYVATLKELKNNG